MVSPASVMPLPLTSTGVPAVLTRVSDAAGAVTGVLVVDGALVTSVPPGGVPVAVALLSTLPAATSAAVMVYVTGPQLDVPAGAMVAGVQAIGVAESLLSFTTTPFNGTLPLLVRANVYAIVSPASVMPLALTSIGAPAVLVRVSAGAAATTGVDVVDGSLVTSVPPGGVP